VYRCDSRNKLAIFVTNITMVFVKKSRVFCEVDCEIYLLFRRGFITVSTEIFRSSNLYCTRLLPVFTLHFQDVSFLQNFLSKLCKKNSCFSDAYYLPRPPNPSCFAEQYKSVTSSLYNLPPDLSPLTSSLCPHSVFLISPSDAVTQNECLIQNFQL
jgi:hypothetical protein